ncbi:MAG: hypothetical protein EBU88_19130, partial [Acidobacteria bacterium]|nr:hypothetical protein [Acidobacteriota bacterium]
SAAPYNLTLLNSANSNYVSSPEARTIWFTISSAEQFQNLFGAPLYYSKSQGLAYWNGSLSVPDGWPVEGIWVDISTVPNPSNLAPGVAVALPQGPQSIGNSVPKPDQIYPQQIGASLYNFPLVGLATKTGTIGLIEPSVGTALPGDQQGSMFNQLLLTYLQNAGQTPSAGVNVQIQGISGQTSASGERSIDVGVVAAVNPNSPLVFYNGSGDIGYAQGTVFTAAQSAAWDTVNRPQVTTNSWGDSQSLAPDSPFARAYLGIFEDAALNNQTTLIALGDGGSGNETGNGLANVENNITQPYNLIVGGTSLSSLGSALLDPTLSQSSGGAAALTSLALAQDPATLWSLMQVGLSQMPSSSNPQQRLVETVWNTYLVNGKIITGNTNQFYTG